MLDLSVFESIEDALVKVEVGMRYRDVARPVLERYTGSAFGMPFLFFTSVISRVEGLHGAVAREARQSNQHAVFPLLRAFAETVITLIYVNDHPKYIEAVVDRTSHHKPGTQKRKSMQALIAHVQTHASGMKDVYGELCEVTHFGSIAMWAPFTTKEEGGSTTLEWTSAPRWKDETQGLIACAQALELAEGAVAFLRFFAVRHLDTPADVW